MSYIWNEYKRVFWFYVIAAFLLAVFAPWHSGPVWLDTAVTILGAYFVLTLWITARTIWLTFWRKLDKGDK